MPRVTFIHPEGKSGEVPPDLSLLEAAEHLGFPLNHDCGGNASCSSCRVVVISGSENLSEIDFEEQDLLDREALTESYHRLGCQSRISGDVLVQVPEEKWGTPDPISGDEVNASTN
ncbi:MAG: 2Fe-2S iron-sulfur cluster-binding protein [Nitrospirota bacterium]|nr:2Fe-2S iron-sulfur cluster-binding protein [Nitrospirota bacterium]